MGTVFSYCDSRLEVPPVAAPPPCTSAKVHLLSHFVEVRTDASQMSAIAIKDLWFSYEVAEVIGGTAKAIDKSAHESPAILSNGQTWLNGRKRLIFFGGETVKTTIFRKTAKNTRKNK